jgi:predicted ATPase/DNA-binding CsgD family transcriptional regulator/class 3 adenylate cyclase
VETVGAVGSGTGISARTQTLVLADFEDAARLRAAVPAAMGQACRRLRDLVSAAAARHGGQPVAEYRGDDVVVAAFPDPSAALAMALDVRRQLADREWPEGLDRQVRIALQTHHAKAPAGIEDARFGVAVSRCARLCAIGRGGHTLVSSTTRELVADRLPEGVRLLDLRIRRLPDLGAPARVYELVGPHQPEHGLPPLSLDARPNNLPCELTTFIGREGDLAELSDALGDARLLTLTGAGGAGKTRLALQAAADAVGDFPDGVWWVELGPASEPRHVALALAAALGLRPRPGQTALDAAVAHLATHAALVLLDNCEHLLAAAAEVADAILRRCPEVTVLATSRAPLGLPSEVTWHVPSLSLPKRPQADGLADLAQSDAVRLFVARAVTVRPDLPLTDESAAALMTVCSRLDGVPLAIELAAARVRLLSVEQIAAGLSDRFRLLTDGSQARPSRHRTLRASVDWSHDLLSGQERALFRRLGIFIGGFSLDAVEHVAAIEAGEQPSSLDLLASLVDKSLVVAEQRGAKVRYRLLETVREYALERLRETDELELVRDRHRDCFLALAERAAPELCSANCVQWLDVLDADAANLAAALEWATASDRERALRMCSALTLWWKLRGMFADAEAGFGRALQDSDAAPAALRARVLCEQAFLLVFAGRFSDAFEPAQRSLELAEEVGEASTIARGLFVMSTIQHIGHPVEVRPMLERSRRLARAGGDNWCLAATSAAAGWSYMATDEYDEAEERFTECLRVVDGASNEFAAWALAGLSFRCMMETRFDRARELADQATAAARELGEPISESFAHMLIARTDLAQGRTERALERIVASREHVIATGADYVLPETETTLAAVRAALGDRDAARGLEPVVASDPGGHLKLTWPLLELARLRHAAGDLAEAEAHARRALEISEALDSPVRQAWSKEILGRVATRNGRWGEARLLLQQALDTQAQLGARLRITQALDGLAEVAAVTGCHGEATRLLAAADRARRDLGLVRWTPDASCFDALERDLRDQLGEEEFAAAWRQGATLTLGETVAWVRRGRGPRKRPPAGWESLTPTELEVARHAATGLSNPEIGEAMFISTGTVRSHLSHIYTKLDIHNRTELAVQVAERMPVGAS